VIVALGGVLITLTILLALAIRERREEAGASATSAPARLLSPQNARNTAVLQR